MADNQKQQRFKGKVVIITGSSAGIGQAAAIEFAKDGAVVVIHGRDGQRINETEQKILALEVPADRILKVQGPIEEEKTAQKLVEETLNKFGRIDVLINNAGCTSKPGNDEPMDIVNLDHIYNVNMRSIVFLTNLAMPHLEKSRGNVLNISSCASHRYMSARVRPYYGVMKAALDHWTRIMALICGEKSGVRVNSINPGTIADTLITERGGQRGPVEQQYGNSVAVSMLQLEICRVLIAHGADVDLGSDDSFTPLLFACAKGSTAIVTLLVESGANVNLGDSEGVTPTMNTSRFGRVELVRFLLSHGASVEQIDYSGTRFALLDAAASGHLEVCRLLVDDWAADVNQQAIDGTTPLMGACSFGHYEITVFLIEHGADIDHADMDGYNALMWAVKYEKAGVARYLLAIGANADQVGIDGKRARDLAQEGRRPEMMDLFRTTANNEQREDGNAQQDEQPQQQQ